MGRGSPLKKRKKNDSMNQNYAYGDLNLGQVVPIGNEAAINHGPPRLLSK